ncbi:MAG: hypothetical protein Roseis2KO_27500 [Roseivirga sp.]
MKEEDIRISHFSKKELLGTLERLFLEHYVSIADEGLEAMEKNEIALNYLAIKKLINESEAS